MGMGQERPRASNVLLTLVILPVTSLFTRAREGYYRVTFRYFESFLFIDFRPGGGIPLLVPQIRASLQALDVLEPYFFQDFYGDQ